jgi:hypothetical protein
VRAAAGAADADADTDDADADADDAHTALTTAARPAHSVAAAARAAVTSTAS